MAPQPVETRLVCGFLEAGKTTYIQDCILNDFYHKYGSTLILAFEQGEAEYAREALLNRRTHVAVYEGGEDITAFCLRQAEQHSPGRIYVEMNSMIPNLREKLPLSFRVDFVTVLVDFRTLKAYLTNLRQQMGDMVRSAHSVTFRSCPSKEALAPYSQAFRLMNRKALYLRQDPMGYHEKAFDLFLPFDVSAGRIEIGMDAYIPFVLDANEHPERYAGKELVFSMPLEMRGGLAGMTVMTCCMADIQFMGFPVDGGENLSGWVKLRAWGRLMPDRYGQNTLLLRPAEITAAKPPDSLMLKGF